MLAESELEGSGISCRNLIECSDRFAEDYDTLAGQSEWFGGDALFGMMFEYVRPGDRLIDLGIGTGLGSQPFHCAGLKISGIDISKPMLSKCRVKGISSDLRLHDLRRPLPFADREFDHAIAVGVFHFIEDVGILVKETSRIIKLGGIFGYTTISPEDESKDVSEQRIHGFLIYQHSHRLMNSLLGQIGFQVLKTTRFTYYSDPSKSVQVTSRTYVARYVGS
jgi:predicted TPR repeat methyltransferase